MTPSVSGFLLFKQLNFIKFHLTRMGKWIAKKSRGGKEWSEVDRNIRSRFPSYPLSKHSRQKGPAGAVPTPAPFDIGLHSIRNGVSVDSCISPWGWRSSKTAFWEQHVFKLQTRKKGKKKKREERKNKCWDFFACEQCLVVTESRHAEQNCPGMTPIWIPAYGRVMVLQLMGWNGTYTYWGMTTTVLMLWVKTHNGWVSTGGRWHFFPHQFPFWSRSKHYGMTWAFLRLS